MSFSYFQKQLEQFHPKAPVLCCNRWKKLLCSEDCTTPPLSDLHLPQTATGVTVWGNGGFDWEFCFQFGTSKETALNAYQHWVEKPGTDTFPHKLGNQNPNRGITVQSIRWRLPGQGLRSQSGTSENGDWHILISRVVLTKETQAASSRILTKRSSNCSTTNSHRDLPEMFKYTLHTSMHHTWFNVEGSCCKDVCPGKTCWH